MASLPEVVTDEQWQADREELLRTEKELTRALDAAAARRRRLPMVEFDNSKYVFDTPDGPKHLLDMFGGQQQLVVYQFMDRGPDEYCPGCTHFTNNVSDLGTLAENGVAWLTVSNMPLPQIQATPRRKAGRCRLSHPTARRSPRLRHRRGLHAHRLHARRRPRLPDVQHHSRGVDRLLFVNNILDLAPYGRQEDWEDSPPGWPQHPTYG